MSKPSAYLIEWEVDGEPRVRVQLDTRMEPWLEQTQPKVTPLYTREALDAYLENLGPQPGSTSYSAAQADLGPSPSTPHGERRE